VLCFPLHAGGLLLLLAALLLSGRWELFRAAAKGAMRVARGAGRGATRNVQGS
jgi:hypothetical protein